MLHNLLADYRDYLSCQYSPETVKTYYKRLAVLLEGQPVLDTAKHLDTEKVVRKLAQIKYKNDFSQSKNALLHFCAFQEIKLSRETLACIDKLGNATKKKYRRLKPVEYKAVDSSIKHLRNMKLKLSYQTILATGLRVSELAGLTSGDFLVLPDEIRFSFIGKGRRNETVTIKAVDELKLHERLKFLISSTSPNQKVFYSATYLQNKAKKLGFACHDLRRSFAKLEYQKCHNKGKVSLKLRHSNLKTTNIYLKSKLKI